MSPPDHEWLTHEQIEAILAGMSADDILQGVGDGTRGAAMVGAIFNAAAHRLGFSNGTTATAAVRAADFKYLATRLGEVVNVDSPLSEPTSDLLASAGTGD